MTTTTKQHQPQLYNDKHLNLSTTSNVFFFFSTKIHDRQNDLYFDITVTFRSNEACIGYFGIRDIGLFFKGYWDICGFFLFLDMGYSGILGYGILEFILGYEINQFWDMGYFGRFILGYGILTTPPPLPSLSN